MKGSHVVDADYDQVVRSPSTVMRLPSVIALREYVRSPSRASTCSFRDRFRCQYCGEQHLRGELSFDHVIPRVDGGKTCWSKIVAACEPCNTLKDRFRLKPLRAPFEHSLHDLLASQRLFPPNIMHETWADYFYWDVELER